MATRKRKTTGRAGLSARTAPSRRASGTGAGKAQKRVSGRKQAERRTATAAKRGTAKKGAIRTGVGTRAKQTTQRRSNKGGRATGGR